LNVQKYSHLKNEARADQIHYTRDPLWWLGMLLMIFGEIGKCIGYTKVHADMACKRPLYFLIWS